MNEMELLRQVAAETPLPAPADLSAARARLTAAIAADPAAQPDPAAQSGLAAQSGPAARSVPAMAEAAVSQPSPSSSQLIGPTQPAPEPVRSAVKLMWGGAAGTAAQLIIALFYLGDIKAYHLTALGHHLTTAQLVHWRPLIVALAIIVALAEIALWLGTARAAGQGKKWARPLSAVLAGLATLQLSSIHSLADLFFAVLTWLTGLAAVWLLWRPAATAFFSPGAGAERRP